MYTCGKESITHVPTPFHWSNYCRENWIESNSCERSIHLKPQMHCANLYNIMLILIGLFVWKTLLDGRPKPHARQDPRFLPKTAVFSETTDFGLKVVKLTNSFHSRVRTQGGHINFFFWKPGFSLKSVVFTKIRGFTIYGQTEDQFASKGNPYILFLSCLALPNT